MRETLPLGLDHASTATCSSAAPIPARPARTGNDAAVSASKRLTALDRNTGELLWTLDAKTSFRHNAICIGAGRLYAIDRPSADQLDWLKRRGDSPTAKPRLVFVDLHSGKVIWTRDERRIRRLVKLFRASTTS